MVEVISEGKNHIIISTSKNYIFYEKLLNTIHQSEDLSKLCKKATSIETEERSVVFEPRKPQKQLESLVLETTTACNFRCEYCIYSGKYSEKRTHGTDFMEFNTAKPFVDYLIKHKKSQSYIGFYGGEPLLNMSLINKVCAYVKSKNIENMIFSVTTNGSLLEENFEDLNKKDIYWNISLDGPGHIHNKQRVSDTDSFENISSILQRQDRISHITLNVTIYDLKKIQEIHEFFSQEPYNKFPLNVSFVETRFLENSQNKVPENIMEIMDDLKKQFTEDLKGKNNNMFLKSLFNKSLSRLANRHSGLIEPTQNTTVCDVAERKIYASVDGRTYPCEKTERMMEVGDRTKVINTKEVNNYLQRMTELRNAVCNSCWYSRLCPVCPAHSAKDVSEEGLFQSCALLKSEFLEGLDLYVRIASEESLSKAFKPIKYIS